MAYRLIFLLKTCELAFAFPKAFEAFAFAKAFEMQKILLLQKLQLLHLQKLLTFFQQKHLWIRYGTY